MKKWLIYVLGIITGIILTFGIALCVNKSNNSGIMGLEMFDNPKDYMDYSQFKVLQVVESDYALAEADDSFEDVVLIISDEKQQFYDNQKISLSPNQRILRVGTYKYSTRIGIEKTVPAVKIVYNKELP